MKYFFLLVCTWTVFPVFAENLPVKRFGIFVGANQGGEGRLELLYARQDAEKIARVMEEIGGIAKVDQKLLVDPKPLDIQKAFEEISADMTASTKRSKRIEFVFYYSGHSNETGLLLGTKPYSYKDLRSNIQNVPADVKIAILDSCSSGAFARMKGGVQKAPFLVQEGAQMKGHAYLTSSSEDESSQESDTLQGSFFTHYLVSGLRGGADRAKDGKITLNEAYEYAFQNTLERTESTKAGPQHPSYEIQLSGTGDLILTDVKSVNTHLQLAPDVSGKIYVRDSQGVLAAELQKAEGSVSEIALSAGTYTITAVTPTKAYSTRVVLESQKAAQVSKTDLASKDLSRFATRGDTPPEAPLTTPNWADSVLESLGISLRTSTERVPIGFAVVPGVETAPFGTQRNASFSALVDFNSGVLGVQASGLLSVTTGPVKGAQFSGIGSVNSETLLGFQGSGVFNLNSGATKGGQWAGMFNIAAGEHNGYVQGAGTFNFALNHFTGSQMAGVFNYVEKDLIGAQFAGMFNIAGDVRGAQFSLINVAKEVQGVQLGLINVNEHIDGAGIGLFFLSPDAYYHPTYLYDQNQKSHFLLQWGMGWFYWVIGGAGWLNPQEKNWENMAGVGVKLENKYAFFDVDAGYLDRYVVQDGASFWNSFNNNLPESTKQPYLRTTFGIKTVIGAFEAGCQWAIGVEGQTSPSTYVATGTLSGKVKFADSTFWFQPNWYVGFRAF